MTASMRGPTPLLLGLATLIACGGGNPVSPPPPPPPPPPAPVASVSLTLNAATLVPQQTLQLVATPKDAAGTALSGRTITWSSDAPAVGTVDATGLVAAVAAGTASVTAQSEGKSAAATITVLNGAFLGPAGGTATGYNGNVTVTVPAGALAVNTAISIALVSSPPADPKLVPGTAYDLGPTGTQFAQPVTLAIKYDPAQVAAGFTPSQLRVYKWTGTIWAALTGSTVNLPTSVATGQTSSFSIYAVHEQPIPVPILTSLSPAIAAIGSGAFTLAVTGTNFVVGSVVNWNGSARPTTFVSPTQLTAAIPASDVATAGTAQVTIFNPTPGGGTSVQLAVSVTNPVPTVAFMLPATAIAGEPALTITLNGSSFVAGSQVRWNGVARTTTFVSATQLTATVTAADLAATTTAPVTVFTAGPGGGTSGSQTFTVAPVMAIAMSDNAACGVKNDGTAYCWGDGEHGQLGNGTNTNLSSTPVAVSGGLTGRQIAGAEGANASRSCLVTVSNAAYCWGFVGGTVNVPMPAPGALSFRVIQVGVAHFCALALTGSAYCWGNGTSGQIGNGSVTTQTLPTAVTGGLTFVALSARGDFSCGLSTVGHAYCWGSGADGSLGNGASANASSPVAVSGGMIFTAISAGTSHACAVTVAGAAYCWGLGTSGELGNGGPFGSQIPVAVSGGLTFVSVSAGNAHTCGITTAGATYCWGTGTNGELGNGLVASSSVPVQVSGGLGWRAVSAGLWATCGVTTSNIAYCWGTKGDGLLGNGQIAWAPAPVAVTGGFTFAAIAVNGNGACAVSTLQKLYCWGGNVFDPSDGQYHDRAAPFLIAGPQTWSKVFSRGGAFCAITTGAATYCWGDNSVGQLGNGTFGSSGVPVPVSGGLSFTGLTSGPEVTCGVTTANALYCWGRGPIDGVGFLVTSNVPVLVPGGGVYSQVAAGDRHICGIRSGAAWCWGVNYDGEIGDGTRSSRVSPVPVAGILTFTSIAAGYLHSCGVATNGDGYCWGNNNAGALGSSGAGSTVPIMVSGGLKFTMVTASSYSCGLATSGTAYCWGDPENGTLGNGQLHTTAESPSPLAPTAVAGPGFSSIASGFLLSSCGLTSGGAALCWGRQDNGGLGNGIFGYVTAPGPVLW